MACLLSHMRASNYSKFLSRSIPTTMKDVFSSCLWTGVAAFRPINADLVNNMDIKRVNGVEIPAMPDDILQYSNDVTASIRHVLLTRWHHSGVPFHKLANV